MGWGGSPRGALVLEVTRRVTPVGDTGTWCSGSELGMGLKPPVSWEGGAGEQMDGRPGMHHAQPCPAGRGPRRG